MSVLDNTDDCPLAESCEGCSTTEDLAVATADTPLGVICLTLCEGCEGRPFPKLGVVEAVTRTATHAGHIGLTIDEVAELRRQEKDEADGQGTPSTQPLGREL